MQIEHEDGELVSITTANDDEDLRVPFSTMQIEVVPRTEQEILDTDDPIIIKNILYLITNVFYSTSYLQKNQEKNIHLRISISGVSNLRD